MRLAQSVLACGGIDGEQRLVRRPGQLLLDHAPHLGELVHQRHLCVQAPGRVGDHDVVPACARGLDGVEHHGARVRAWVGAHDLALGTLSPFAELLLRGGAVGVRGGHHHRQPGLPAQVPCHLADRRGLAGAVHAHDQQHRRLMGHVDAVIADPGNLRQQLTQTPLEFVSSCDRALAGLALEALHDLGGRAGSDVRVDQDLLEALPRLVVERPGEGGSELAAERFTRLREVLAQPPEEAAAPRLVVRRGRRDLTPAVRGDEDVLPGPRHGGMVRRAPQARSTRLRSRRSRLVPVRPARLTGCRRTRAARARTRRSCSASRCP